MNPLVLLAGVGVMVALAGLVLGAAGVAGVAAGRPARTHRRLVLRRSWLAAAAVGLLVLVATGWVAVAAGAAGACVIVPAILASGAEADTRIARLEALAGFTRRLADLLASGAVGSLDHALHRAATGCPPAIKPEVAALVSRMGPQGLEPALRAFGRDLADPAGDHVAMALILRARNGGRGLATVLQNLASDVDERVLDAMPSPILMLLGYTIDPITDPSTATAGRYALLPLRFHQRCSGRTSHCPATTNRPARSCSTRARPACRSRICRCRSEDESVIAAWRL
jgi:hypothetical protein